MKTQLVSWQQMDKTDKLYELTVWYVMVRLSADSTAHLCNAHGHWYHIIKAPLGNRQIATLSQKLLCDLHFQINTNKINFKGFSIYPND